MGLEEYIPRPTVPQIRNGKQEVMYKPGSDLTQVESLSGDSQFMRIADQVLPDSLFPSAEDILYRNHSWDRTGVSRSFMKKSKFYSISWRLERRWN